jgi:hypothetical protein
LLASVPETEARPKRGGEPSGHRPGAVSSELDLRSGRGGAVEMQVGVERGAEAMDEGHGTEAGLRGCTGATGLQSVLDRLELDPQHRPDKRGLMVEEKK